MSVNKIIIIFGIILVIFAGVVFYQFNRGIVKSTPNIRVDGKVTINNHTFNVEIPKTSKDKAIGLIKYNSLKADEGMLFLFDATSQYSFWMRGMKFPIDMIFILDDSVVGVFEQVPAAKESDTNIPYYGSELTSNKVLEVSPGLAKKYNIKKGDKVKIETNKNL